MMAEPELAVYILLGILCVYLTTSILFFVFPTIIHKKRRSNLNVFHISHRGGAAEKLENSADAFENAYSVGTDMFEIDCQRTKDGKIVICHDNNLERLTGEDVDIRDLEYAEIPPFMENIKVTFDPSISVSSAGQSLMCLEDLFRKFPNMPINLDVKECADVGYLRQITDLIVEYARQELTVVGNWNYQITSTIRKLNPDLMTLCTMKELIIVVVSFYFGLLPFIPLHFEFYEIPMPSIANRNGFLSKTWQKVVLNVIDFLVMNRLCRYHLARRGIKTFVWVLNEDDHFDRALWFGADGIMTDRPSKLAQYMIRNNVGTSSRCFAPTSDPEAAAPYQQLADVTDSE